MAKKKRDSNLVLLLGLVIFAWGLLNSIHHVLRNASDVGVTLAFGAHMIIGLLAVLIAMCLKKIEERLDKLEK